MAKRVAKKEKVELIPAVAYIRKSTKGKTRDGGDRQEKSLAQQREEITKLAKGKYQILEWFEDDGISGWKRGPKRPDYQRMINGVKRLGAQVLLCDHIDRFSRGAYDDVQEDASALRKAGCRYIVTASHGQYDLGARYDIGCIVHFAVAVWAACEYSRQLSRRVSLARRNQAADGKRPGGRIPYGYTIKGQEHLKPKDRILKPGDAKEVRTVRWVFDQYVNQARSCNWICNELNRKKVPSPGGGTWCTATVQKLIQRPVYKGDMLYNLNPMGQFFRIDEQGEVVDVEQATGEGKVYRKTGAYKGLVDKKLFDAAQRRMKGISENKSRRKRVGYCLTGILMCGECGGPMHGITKNDKYVVYRCSTTANKGRAVCGLQQVRQDEILPWILDTVKEEIADLQRLLSEPPDELRRPRKREREQRAALEERQARLTEQIKVATRNVMLVSDARTRKDMDRTITEMRDELEDVERQLEDEPTTKGYTRKELVALNDWWNKFTEQAVSVPVGSKTKVPEHAVFWQDPETEEERYLVDPRVLNELLASIGCTVTLQWRTEQLANGRNRYTLEQARLRLGQNPPKTLKYLSERSVHRSQSPSQPADCREA